MVGLPGMESSLCTYPCSEALPTGGRKCVLEVKMQCDDRKCGPTAGRIRRCACGRGSGMLSHQLLYQMILKISHTIGVTKNRD